MVNLKYQEVFMVELNGPQFRLHGDCQYMSKDNLKLKESTGEMKGDNMIRGLHFFCRRIREGVSLIRQKILNYK